MLLFYFQTNKQKISSLQVVLKEELHTDTLHGHCPSDRCRGSGRKTIASVLNQAEGSGRDDSHVSQF